MVHWGGDIQGPLEERRTQVVDFQAKIKLKRQICHHVPVSIGCVNQNKEIKQAIQRLGGIHAEIGTSSKHNAHDMVSSIK